MRVDDLDRPRDLAQRQALELRGDVPALDRRRDVEAETRFRKVEGYRGLAHLAVAIEHDLLRKRHLDSYTSTEEATAAVTV